MGKKIHFVKMHGLGNDYIFVDESCNEIPDPKAASIAWSHRHFSIGSDGLVLIGRADGEEADFTMRFFNADGTEGEMCGNASRCIAKYVYERGLTDKTCVRLLTASGIKILNLSVRDGIVERVTVDMLEPILKDDALYRPDIASPPEGVFVSMGCPHYVIFVPDIDCVDVAAEGSRLEYHPAFPQRCNIEFVQVLPEGLRMRVWERGSGITMACGTGACATAVAAAVTGRSGQKSRVDMDGGTLHIEWRESDNHVYMSGPAALAFEGDVELPEK